MAQRVSFGACVLALAGLGLAVACSNYVPPDVSPYGPPNGLKSSPTPPSGSSSSSSGSSSGGTTGTGEDAGGGSSGDGGTPMMGAVTYACGTPLADAGACSISWTKDIYPKMAGGGTWNCGGASPCHGGTQAPVLTGDEHSYYTTLANYTGTAADGHPYFDPCSTVAANSDFLCNVSSTGTCGAALMPLGAAIADTSSIATWVGCGAPEN